MPHDQDRAQHHWSEANKYAFEGMKSIFYVNNITASAFLAYINIKDKTANFDAKTSITLFGVAGFFSILNFMLGYNANLQYGNYYTNTSEEKAAKFWKFGQCSNIAAWISVFSSIGCYLAAGIFALKFLNLLPSS